MRGIAVELCVLKAKNKQILLERTINTFVNRKQCLDVAYN